MATIEIAGRKLEVKPATIRIWKDQWVPYKADVALIEASKDEVKLVERAIDLMLVFIGHNDGVTKEWILDNATWPLPLDDVLTAAGLRKKDPAPGEGAGQ